MVIPYDLSLDNKCTPQEAPSFLGSWCTENISNWYRLPIHRTCSFLPLTEVLFFLGIKFNNMGLTEFFFELQLSDSSSTQFLFPYLPLQHHSQISPDSTSDLKYLNLVLLNKMLNVFRNYLVSYRQVEFSIKIPTRHSLSLSELSPNSSYTISDFW